jgi:hypothetical protein
MSQGHEIPLSPAWQERLGERFSVDADSAFRELEAAVVGGGGGALASSIGAWLLCCYGPDRLLPTAMAWAEDACEKAPEDPEIRHTAAWAYASAESWEGAARHLALLLHNPAFLAEDLEDLAHLALKSVPSGSGARLLAVLEQSPRPLPAVVAALRLELGLEIAEPWRAEAEALRAAYAALEPSEGG